MAEAPTRARIESPPALRRASARPASSGLFPAVFIASFAVLTRGLCLLVVARGAGTGLGGAIRVWGTKWDASWYGYDVIHPYSAATHAGLAGIGFYPGYPVLAWLVNLPLRLIAHLVPGVGPRESVWWSLIVVSNACLIVALVALWHLFLPRLGPRATLIGLALFLAAPGSFVLSAGFSESAFIAASALAFLCAERRRWLLCGVFAGAAACIRIDGALLLLPLALLWLIADRRLSLALLAGVAAAIAGIGAYPLFLWASFGNPLLYVRVKDQLWGNHWALAPTLVAMVKSIPGGVRLVLQRVGLSADATPHQRLFGALVLLNPATVLIALLSIPAGWIGLGLPYALWTLLAILAPVSSGLSVGLPRYTLAAWPAYFALGWLLRRTPLAVPALAVVLSLIAMLVVAFDFTQGYFVV